MKRRLQPECAAAFPGTHTYWFPARRQVPGGIRLRPNRAPPRRSAFEEPSRRPGSAGCSGTARCARTLGTSQSTGKVLTIRVLPELQAALDAMPHRDALTFLLTDYGRPFASPAAFGNKFADWCDAAKLEPVLCDDGKVRNYRAHGLRKAACKQLAHAGCTAPEIMAVSGHASLAEVQKYISAVEQDRLAEAAMVKRAARSNRAQMGD